MSMNVWGILNILEELESPLLELEKVGLVIREIPSSSERLRRILELEPYKSNSFLQRMRSGEKFSDMLEELIDQNTPELRSHKERREAYNQQVKDSLLVCNWNPFGFYARPKGRFLQKPPKYARRAWREEMLRIDNKVEEAYQAST